MLAVGRNIRLVASLTKVQHHYSLTNAFQLVFSGKAYCKVDFLSTKFSRGRTISYQSLLLSTTVLNDVEYTYVGRMAYYFKIDLEMQQCI